MVVGPAPVRARLMSLLVRPTAPLIAPGMVVAASLIVARSLLVYLLKHVGPGNAFDVVYLIGVSLVSTVWVSGWRWRRRWRAPFRSTASVAPSSEHRSPTGIFGSPGSSRAAV
jgi:hypothetical protein